MSSFEQADLDDADRRARFHKRACGCSKEGPCVVGRCSRAAPSEAPLLATTCACCGYAVIRSGRCVRCLTAAAEIQP